MDIQHNIVNVSPETKQDFLTYHLPRKAFGNQLSGKYIDLNFIDFNLARGTSLYSATKSNGRKAVLKVFNAPYIKDRFGTADTLAFYQEFEEDIKQLSRCDHKNISKVYSQELHDPINSSRLSFVEHEYMPSGTLLDYIYSHEVMGLQMKIDALHQVSQAIAYAHSKGIVHGDITPDNIYLSLDGYYDSTNKLWQASNLNGVTLTNFGTQPKEYTLHTNNVPTSADSASNPSIYDPEVDYQQLAQLFLNILQCSSYHTHSPDDSFEHLEKKYTAFFDAYTREHITGLLKKDENFIVNEATQYFFEDKKKQLSKERLSGKEAPTTIDTYKSKEALYTNIIYEYQEACKIEFQGQENVNTDYLDTHQRIVFPVPLQEHPIAEIFYTIDFSNILGRTKYASLFRAKENLSKRNVIIEAYQHYSASNIKAITNRAKILANITTPHIQQTYLSYHSKEAEQSFLALESPKGQTISSIFNAPAGLIAIENKVATCIQLAKTLQQLHDNDSMLHTSLTPQHIMIDSQSNSSTILNYGVSSNYTPLESFTNYPLANTSRYLPREISIHHQPFHSLQSTLYSFGVTMYEFLTNQPLSNHLGQSSSYHSILPETDLLTESLLLICQKATNHNLQSRYNSYTALAKDLEQVYFPKE